MKNGLKVLLALLFVVAMSLFIFSCNGTEETTTATETEKTQATITLDANGGDGLSNGSFTVRIGRKISSSKLPELIKTGYVFDGWFTEDGEEWNLNNKVEDDMTLVAHWSVYVCDHVYSVSKTVKATCEKDGYTEEKCSVCGDVKTTPVAMLGHDISSEYVEVQKATNYGVGIEAKKCSRCDFEADRIIVPALKDLSGLNIDTFKVSGKTYVDIAKYACAEASSVYTICSPLNAVDQNLGTCWQPDTLADGANFTGEWLLLKFEKDQKIAGVSVSMANYDAWELGDGCYQSFDVEAYVNGSWQKVGTVSDKNVGKSGIVATDTCTFSSVVTTSQLRFTVTNSGRYTPAMIKEIAVYADNDNIVRTERSLYKDPAFITSGKYNEWATGSDKINDGNDATGWHGGPYADESKGEVYIDGTIHMIAEYPSEQYIAHVTWLTSSTNERIFELFYWEDGAWKSLGEFSGKLSYDVEVNKTTSKLKLNFKKQGQYWDCQINDFEAFTVMDTTFNVDEYSGCMHKLTDKSAEVVTKPTCESAGYTTAKCKNCDYTWKTSYTDALGHNFGQYVSTATASATVLGTQTATCQKCQKTRVRNVPKTVDGTLEPATITSYYRNAPAAWSMTFDDGCYLGTIEWLIPELQSRGFKATAVLTIGMMESLKSNWDTFLASGVIDIGSHSYTHTGGYSGTASATSLYNEVNGAVYKLMEMFPGQRLLGFATPGGATSESAGNFVSGMHAGCRNGGQFGGDYVTLEQLTTGGRTRWGNLSSFVAKNDTTNAIIKSTIDALIANHGWSVECNHAISGTGAGGDVITIDKNVKLYELDYLKEKGVWVGSYNEVIQYIKEAQNCTVNVTDNSSTQIKLSLTDTLDNFMFNFPLTIKVDVPSSWTNVSATQNGAAVHVFVEDGYAYVDAVPDAGEIVVTKK